MRNLSYLFILFLSTSCSAQIGRSYCNKNAKLINTTLNLNQNQEFVLQTKMKFHETKDYYQTGPFVIEKDSLLLVILREGIKVDSLPFLPQPDTLRGVFRKNRLIFFGKEIDENYLILRRCPK